MYAIREPLDWHDEDETRPIYSHPSIKFKHLAKFWIVASDGQTFKVSTTEDEDVCGLFISDNESIDTSDERIVEIDWSGRINQANIKIEMDNISEVHLTIGKEQKIVAAGEVEPRMNGYTIRKLDESVLLFDRPVDFENTVFGQSFEIDLTNQTHKD